MEIKPGEDARQASVSAGHELSDAEGRPLAVAGLNFGGDSGCDWDRHGRDVLFLREGTEAGTASHAVRERAHVHPLMPRLQVDPKMELKEYRDSQREILNSYGWVDIGPAGWCGYPSIGRWIW